MPISATTRTSASPAPPASRMRLPPLSDERRGRRGGSFQPDDPRAGTSQVVVALVGSVAATGSRCIRLGGVKRGGRDILEPLYRAAVKFPVSRSFTMSITDKTTK